ncbi:MAG TPA: hypothetical protein VMT81_00630 [Candidatus Paceibacterota bacterium]|nr:hypothetical protein [Candidatus Paceibacterota bacterium]
MVWLLGYVLSIGFIGYPLARASFATWDNVEGDHLAWAVRAFLLFPWSTVRQDIGINPELWIARFCDRGKRGKRWYFIFTAVAWPAKVVFNLLSISALCVAFSIASVVILPREIYRKAQRNANW